MAAPVLRRMAFGLGVDFPPVAAGLALPVTVDFLRVAAAALVPVAEALPLAAVFGCLFFAVFAFAFFGVDLFVEALACVRLGDLIRALPAASLPPGFAPAITAAAYSSS